MEKIYKKPENCEFTDLHERLTALVVSGYRGLCVTEEEVRIIFEDSKTKLTAAELKKLDSLFDNYTPKLSMLKVREMREGLFAEADWKFNKAIDEDNQELIGAIKDYRKQLRDITLIEDTALLEWPKKPWE